MTTTRLPRPVRKAVRRLAAAAARRVAADADRRAREALAAEAADLLAAGRPVRDVLAELAGAHTRVDVELFLVLDAALPR
jgi:hypothetical protein